MSPKEPLMHTTGHLSRISSVLSVRLAVFLYTGYGKVLNLKMKNGLNFEIPVNGMTEDVEQFRLLIGKE